MAFALTVTTTHTKTLISPSTGVEDKVYGEDYVSLTSHTSTLGVADATSGGVPFFSSSTAIGTSALLAAGGVVIGGGAGNPPLTSSKLSESSTAGAGLVIAAGTATTDVSALSVAGTLNAAGVTYSGAAKISITDTASAADSLLFSVLGGAAGATGKFSVNKSGYVRFHNASGSFAGISGGAFNGELYFIGASGVGTPSYFMDSVSLVARSGGKFAWTSSSTDAAAATVDTNLSRISAGVIGAGTGAAGSFAGRIKATSGIVAAVAVGALNATPTVGEIQTVNDALAPVAGAAVAAGGAANALVWWNGAQWTVVQV